MNKTLALLFVLATAVNTYAQVWCGTDKLLQKQMDENPGLKESIINALTQEVNAAQHQGRAIESTVYVPVVIHVVHNGDAVGVGENISDAQCISQIDALNRDFNFLDEDIANVPDAFRNLVANVGIKFCLAKFDPAGNPTSGIDRQQFTNGTWDTEDDIDQTLKPATTWDYHRYLNIWSVRMGGDLTSTGVLAYATLPFSTSATTDGIVARYNTIGTTGSILAGYQRGKTVTHEAGHWFGLLHVWGFSANCNDQGDFISDTPDQADLNFGCPSFPHVSCTGSAPNGDMFMNYMDYTDDGCRNMFTLAQAERMLSSLSGSRSSILNAATQCFYTIDAAVVDVLMPSDTICSTTFRPLIRLRNAGLTPITTGKFYYNIDGGAVELFDWTGNLNPQEEVLVNLPEHSVGSGDHTFDVTFSNPNGLASDNFSGNDGQAGNFYAYEVGVSSGIPFTEDFESAGFPGNTYWYTENPNLDRTWVLNNAVSAYGTGSYSVSIDNLTYPANPNRKSDAIVTDVYDFRNNQYPQVKFDVAYAKVNATRSDVLNLYYTLDCGTNWNLAWSQSGSTLATAPDQTTAFVPTSAQWKTVSVPMLDVAQQSRVIFKFENVSSWGNILYLDNINIENNPSLGVSDVKKVDVKIYPNPASNMVAFRLPYNHPFNTLQIFNTMGEMMYSAATVETSTILNIDNYAGGVYFVKLSGDNFTQTEKLIITR